MAYLSLYRKWRPQTFEEVISQTHVTRTLQNAIRMNRIGHAYLFCGPRGTGKTTVAKLLAKALNCKNGPTPTPCNECTNCRQIREGFAMDVIEIDGASNRGIDEIRDLREKVKFAPAEAKYKVYIIDEVHMLTSEAFNALLKTLEEPPAHVVFIFATTEPHKIPATILSRCQRFDFKRISVPELSAHLTKIAAAEGLKVSPQTIALIARSAEGGLRDALSILDQCASFSGAEITSADVETLLGTVDLDVLLKFTGFAAAGDLAGGLQLIEDLRNEGKDLHQFARDLMGHLRNLLLVNLAPQAHLAAVDAEAEALLITQASLWHRDALIAAIEVVAHAEDEIRWASQNKLPLELALIQLVTLANDAPPVAAPAPVKVAAPPAVSQPIAEPEAVKASIPVPAKPRRSTPSRTAASVATLDSGTIDLGTVRTRWNDFLAALRHERLTTVATQLRPGTPAALVDGKLYVEFSPADEFFRRLTESEAPKVERVLHKFFGVPMAFAPVSEGAAPHGEATAVTTALAPTATEPNEVTSHPDKAATAQRQTERFHSSDERVARQDPLVQKAIETFGATIVKVEP